MVRRTPVVLGLFASCLLALTAGAPVGSAAASDTPVYANYPAPGGLANDAGEPSVGVNGKTGAVFLQAGLETERVIFGNGGQPTWTNVAPLQTSLTTADPIGYSDVSEGRMFVSQLTGFDSLSAFTDDDGKTWTSSQGGGIPSGVDHQSIGSGPYPADSPLKAVATFPHAVYYCSQEAATAFCARSDNGGLTFGVGVPLYTINDCGGLHGHVRVSPDGTVYVPNKSCSGKQGVAVSRDAGLTWTLHLVPGSTANTFIIDPSIGPARDNSAYYGFVGADGLPRVTVTHDHGSTFSPPVEVGTPVGVHNATFPEVIAGDPDRAAFAFLGTSTEGVAQSPKFGTFNGSYDGATYHLFISSTFDGGRSWKTVDVTGNDPVQRGEICNGGTLCSANRNLADFMDIQVDKQGRVLVAWADGCVGTCVTSTLIKDNTFAAKGTITRQIGGPLLFAQAAAPSAAPLVQGPVTAPHGQRTGRGGSLAATGNSLLLSLGGGLLLVAALGLRRRVRG